MLVWSNILFVLKRQRNKNKIFKQKKNTFWLKIIKESLQWKLVQWDTTLEICEIRPLTHFPLFWESKVWNSKQESSETYVVAPWFSELGGNDLTIFIYLYIIFEWLAPNCMKKNRHSSLEQTFNWKFWHVKSGSHSKNQLIIVSFPRPNVLMKLHHSKSIVH